MPEGTYYQGTACTQLRAYLLCFEAEASSVDAVQALLNVDHKLELSPQQPLAQQQRQPPKRVRVSQEVSERLIVKRVQPDYPLEAPKNHVQGSVVIQVLISKTGDITTVRVVSGDEQLVPSAVEAVRQWKYTPYVLNGQPIEVETQATVNYQLP